MQRVPGRLFLTLAIASCLSAQGGVAEVPETGRARTEKLVGQLGDDAKTLRAQHQLLGIGTPAVQTLLRTAVRKGSLVDSPAGRRALALLGRMGPRAAHVFDDLADILPRCQGRAFLDVLDVLGDLVPYSQYQGKPEFLERLVYSDRERLERLKRGNDRQRFQYRLNRLQQRSQVDPGDGLSAMIAVLEENRTHRREVAAEVVGRMGKAAKRAAPAILRAMAKGAPVVGQIGGFRVPKYRDGFPRAAADALIAILPGDPRTAVAWAYKLEHSELPAERIRATMQLGSFGEKAKAHIDVLVDALRDREPRVRHEAATALGMIGPAALRAKFTLKKLTESDDKALAARAKAALRLIVPK